MNGVHDCGGMDGFGPIPRARGEALFAHEWEERVFALDGAITALGFCSIDEMRHAAERMPPADYLAASYYERWFAGYILVLTERGIVSQDEMSGGAVRRYEGPLWPRLDAADVPAYVSRRRSHRSPANITPRFRVGDKVRALNLHPKGHTRMPRYVRGHQGEIVRDHGVFAFPDAIAHDREDVPQHLYTVRFSADEIWGEAGEPGNRCMLDLYEQYLAPA